MIFQGASASEIRGVDPYPDYSNYFIGNDPTKWASGARAFQRVDYVNILPGITLSIYSKGGHLKYDWILSATADPTHIAVRYVGIDDLSLADGELKVQTSVNTVTESAPVSWKVDRGGSIMLACSYRLEGNTVYLSFPAGYKPGYAGAVIDPVLSFATYSGSTADNFGFTATYDRNDLMIGGGIVFGTGYPLSSGAFQQTFGGGSPFNPGGGVDVAITKFNANGSALVFSTYLGGNGDETPNSCIVTSSNDVLVFGVTGSSNFPTTPGCFDNSFDQGASATFPSNGTYFEDGTDIYVAKLNATGTTLLGSTYVGGTGNDGLNNNGTLKYNYADQFRGEVIVDDNDNVIIASSSHSSNFPTSPGVFQPATAGLQEGVLFQLSPDLTSMMWSSYFGGSSNDAIYSVRQAGTGDLVITGGTSSLNLATTGGVAYPAFQGGSSDAFVGRILSNGSAIQALTYLGTTAYDQSYFVDLSIYNEIYVTGQTSGVFPTTAGVYINPNSGQFVTKLSLDLTSILASTVFGKGDGNPELSPTAFLVDDCHNIYVSGWGGATNTPTTGALNTDGSIGGMPLVASPYQSTTDNSDFYFIVFEPDFVNMQYSTYFGGSASSDHVDGGTCRFNKAGAIYSAVCASCGGANNDFPTTPGAWSSTDQSSTPQPNCNLAVFKFDFQLPIAHAFAVANPDDRGCEPFQVSFSSAGSTGLEWFWDFGDGNTSTVAHPTHTYTDSGTYSVMFVALDTTVCYSFDTTYLTIQVVAPPNLVAQFSDPPDGCQPLDVQLVNSSSDPGMPFQWDFGDGTTSTAFEPSHTYSAPGTFTIQLILVDTGVCQAHDTVTTTVDVFPQTVADFVFTPGFPQENDLVTFTNLSTNDIAWAWDFGDLSTSSVRDPTHQFTTRGTYDVCLISYNANGCNDTVCKQLEVFPPRKLDIPTAFSPNGDGNNDLYYHYADGFISANLRIFNRWGLLVFETDDLSVGWDGKWNGTDQELAVFAYILTITFADTEEPEIYSGNVTLLR
jgi:gliding motility-associated-like protein